MTLRIHLEPKTEANIAANARASGLALPEFVEELLRSQFGGEPRPQVSNEERIRIWLEDIIESPDTPLLSDYAVSRESMYDTDGQ